MVDQIGTLRFAQCDMSTTHSVYDAILSPSTSLRTGSAKNLIIVLPYRLREAYPLFHLSKNEILRFTEDDMPNF